MRFAGRLMLIKIGDGGTPEEFTTVAAQRGTGNSQASASIETTTKDNRWRQLLQGGVNAISFTAKGLIADASSHRLLSNLAAQDAVRTFQIVFANGQTITAPCRVETWAASADYDAVQQYELTLVGATVPHGYSLQPLLLIESGDAVLLTEGGDELLLVE